MSGPWFCRLIGHWWKYGRVYADSIHFANYRECRICGLYEETPYDQL